MMAFSGSLKTLHIKIIKIKWFIFEINQYQKTDYLRNFPQVGLFKCLGKVLPFKILLFANLT